MKIENLVVCGVLAFALAAMGFGVVLYPLYREVVGLRDENRVTTVWEQFSGGTIVERKKPLRAGDDAMTDTAPTP